MKKIYLAFVLSLLLPSLPLQAANEQVLDRIVAVVNDDIILQSEYELAVRVLKFELAMEKALRAQKGQEMAIPPQQQIEAAAINRVVDRKLLLQQANVSNINIADQQIDEVIADSAKNYGLSVRQLANRLNRFGINMRQYRHEIEEQIMVNQILFREIGSLIQVSKQEVDNFIAGQVNQGNVRYDYNLSLIYIAATEGDDKAYEAKLKQAQSIARQLQQGADFGQLAKQYSSHESATRGGKLGWRSSSSLPPALVSALMQLEAGQTSKVVRSADGFYIIHLNNSRNSANLTRTQVERNLQNRKIQEQQNLLMIRLRNEAHIDIRI